MDEKQKNYFNEVYIASKRMSSLINSLLNVSRLELGTYIVDPKETNLVDLMNQLIQDLTGQINSKHITLKKIFQSDMPLLIVDPKLLTIVLQNLLANAIKYSKDAGVIEIKTMVNAQEFMISISDDGYGIPKNQQTKIFTKLFRADNARSLVPEGTGLGLYIVKQIVDTTGGKIWFTSEENKGTIFTLAFPISGMKQRKGDKELR